MTVQQSRTPKPSPGGWTPEFALISALLEKRPVSSPSTPLPVIDVGDDAAVLRVGGKLFAISTDTVAQNRHFLRDHFSCHDIGIKAIGVAVSDIAAMGGRPSGVLVAAITSVEWPAAALEEIYLGIHEACASYDCKLLGGNITAAASSLALTVTAFGEILSDRHLTPRSTARPGDLIYVSGTLGNAAAGLLSLEKKLDGYELLKAAQRRPKARTDIAETIALFANAMIDISDGFAADLRHLCHASEVGAVVHADAIPLSTELQSFAAAQSVNALSFGLGGGEDYELLYTIPPSQASHAIGHCVGAVLPPSNGITMVTPSGEIVELPRQGWDHFLS